MTEDKKKIPKKAPAIPPSVRRLISSEALKYPRVPRAFLAEQLQNQIKESEAMGEDIAPTTDTLERLISNARSNEVKAVYFNIGESFTDIPTEALPYIFAVRKWIKADMKLAELPKMHIVEAAWVAKLYPLVEHDPKRPELYYANLAIAAKAYTFYQIVSLANEQRGKDVDASEPHWVDTTELDNLLAAGDYLALLFWANQLNNIMDAPEQLPNVVEHIRDVIKRNPM